MAKRNHIKGVDRAIANLQGKINEIEGVTMKGLIRGAIIVKREAVKLTPRDTGNLRASAYIVASRSGTVDSGGGFEGDNASEMKSHHSQALAEREAAVGTSGKPTVEIGYTAVYAAPVHENPNVGAANPTSRAEKGQWKFLEQALKDNEAEIIDVITEEARDAARR